MIRIKAVKKKDLDVRIKLLFIIESGLLSFFTGSNMLICITALASLFILLCFRQVSTAWHFGVVFLIILGISSLSPLWEGRVFGMVLGMLTFLILRMIPVLMLGSWLVHSVKINDFIASMEKMKLPVSVIIPLAVTLRFMPTIQAEFGYIKNTMKMKGISLSLSSVLRRPLMTTEYAMVPLLMRSIKVADELSASVMTRGLGNHKKRTSYRDIRLNRFDIIWALGFTLFTVSVSLCSKLPIL